MKLIVSKRVFLTLPDAVADDLELWAEAEGNKAASLAGFIVELAVRQAREQGKIPKRSSGELIASSQRATQSRTQINILDVQRLADQLEIPSDRLLKAAQEIKLDVINES